MKVTKQEQKEHAQLVEALTTHEQRVQAEFDALLAALRKAPHSLNYAIRARNEVAKNVEAFAERVHDRLEEEFDEKSERWQEGDAGQAAQELISEWSNIDINEMQEVTIVEPELDDTGIDLFRDLSFDAS